MIRFLKQRLSIAERANGDGRWAVHLPGILRDYNAQNVPGTDVRRSGVNQDNYLALLAKLYRSPDPSMRFNMAESFHYPSALSRYLWKYAVGDRVMVARRVDYDLRDKNYFEKPSVAGSFGPAVHTVAACKTKLNADLFLNPAYALKGLSGLFYESELTPALFDGGGRRRRRGAPRESPTPPPAPAGSRRQRKRDL